MLPRAEPTPDVPSGEACEVFEDCCKCSGLTLLPADVQGCSISTGIVVAEGPWGIHWVEFDGMSLAEGDGCDQPDAMWVHHEQNGERSVELCNEACTTYLDGAFGELTIGMFCEVG
ncbi:hypothetical protein [Nannocystis radixulma]|uniref:Uncharacterized protein n=1 Tax=Nannocystis radixulma TaxID=2995305 RepID=A0ABT5BBB3_9BACT|nr:hypothetical protein [Nannocystis radixulma]MDC0670327.1 hypothetical protein [Nannocystis radixulma]